MKVLVSGGGGFIGLHTVKVLLAQGHEVVVYDDFSTNKRSDFSSQLSANSEKADGGQQDSLTVVEGDVRDSKLLVESLLGVDAVVHMASFISVEESVEDPVKYMENNVLGTATLLAAMREAGVKKIVFSSSATVYGTPKSLPVTEEMPLSAANPYAATKIASESICESFYNTDRFDVSILRYFNPYGPGEVHDPETHAIPNFVKAALSQAPHPKGEGVFRKIPLYWGGEQVRDFIYVEDLAEAHAAVLELSGYNIFNVGTEKGTKIVDVVNVLSDILGYEVEVEDRGDRKGDVMANYASSAKLKEATGWEAKVGLEEGLRRTVEWFRIKVIGNR